MVELIFVELGEKFEVLIGSCIDLGENLVDLFFLILGVSLYLSKDSSVVGVVLFSDLGEISVGVFLGGVVVGSEL